MPVDLEQLPQFKKLNAALGVWSLWVWWTLWREFKYRAQEGLPAGRWPKLEVAALIQAVTVNPGGMGPKPILEILIECKLLLEDGEDYVCPRFAVLHGEGTGARSAAQKGGDMRAFKHRQEKLDHDILELGLQISGSKFVDEEGQALPAEECRRVTRLIVACDNALFKQTRPPFGFTEGLIQTARGVLKKFADEQIDYICKLVAKNRNHPFLGGMTTEKLMPEFGNMIEKLGGNL